MILIHKKYDSLKSIPIYKEERRKEGNYRLSYTGEPHTLNSDVPAAPTDI